MDPLAYRMKFIMPQGYHDAFSGNTNYYDSFRQCLEKGKAYIDYDRKKAEFAKDTGPIRRGIGVAAFWYNTGGLSHFPGDLLQPDAAQSGRHRYQCSAARRRSARGRTPPSPR